MCFPLQITYLPNLKRPPYLLLPSEKISNKVRRFGGKSYRRRWNVGQVETAVDKIG